MLYCREKNNSETMSDRQMRAADVAGGKAAVAPVRMWRIGDVSTGVICNHCKDIFPNDNVLFTHMRTDHADKLFVTTNSSADSEV